ncbi:molybdopterin oxidoreductase family protein [Roseibacillus ishigakijimensis]|uniref:Molybdopterin-dependent oxidoreductase n=1 Tax=Roseibacillus ishigakijimensis TaxID=454146 RepID=A0A934VGX1_9BACT|nr:molybdopterin-dependent oxidoreductase [Roseibacillus ishigakijimensis]MBK1833328.1 molybdopterin-dependent oxidoreductase [Roseibacillus ishigakijimensis]
MTIPRKDDKLLDKLREHVSLHARTGSFTSELVREPGKFGLGQVPKTVAPDATTTSVCGYCSTGCRLRVHLKEGQAVNLTPSANYPVNLGMACPKGWEALSVLAADDRGTTPLLEGRPVDWSTALDTFCDRFQAIQNEHGKESVAFLSTGQITLEEFFLLGSFTKFGMGLKHGDGNTRQCMATSVVAYKQSFGFDAPPYTYADFEESDTLVFIGANPAIAHPIMWQRVMKNQRQPDIVVIDPRRTETAQVATHHVALKPKSDLLLLYGLAHLIVQEDRLDQESLARTEGFADFRAFLSAYPPEKVAPECGLSVRELNSLARLVSEPGKRVSWWWTMGVNQSYEGVRTAQAIINLCLMTGNIGKPGTGANSITGQCNAMGSRLFSNTTNLLGGHDFANPAHRAKVAGIVGIAEEQIQHEPGYAYDQIIEAIDRGEIKGLWIIATNPNHSWIAQKNFARIREKLDFLVVQDMYHNTETAQMADLYLPAAGWGEKDGILINSERRLGVIRQVKKAPGQALSDFRIVQALADRWGGCDFLKKFPTPAAAFAAIKELSRDQPCEITGIGDYDHLEEAGGIQWPYPERKSPGRDDSPSRPLVRERRLFEDGVYYTDSGKARFHYDHPSPLAEPTDADFPFILLTGRGTSSQWHTQSRTSKSKILQKLYPKNCYLEIHPEDARALGIADRETVTIASRRATIRAQAYYAPTVQRGQVFLPMHYPEVNQLTHASFDPHSRQPSYKYSAVRVGKGEG